MEETKKVGAQELGRRLVDRHVQCCVSSLISDLGQLTSEASPKRLSNLSIDAKDVLTLQGGEPNYQEAAEQAGWRRLDDHEHEQLWDHLFVKEKKDARDVDYQEALELRGWMLYVDEEEGTAEFHLKNYGLSEAYRAGDLEVAPGDSIDVKITLTDEQKEDNDLLWVQLAQQLGVAGTEATFDADGDENEAWEAVCSVDGIDADDYRREPYEHWIVDWWLARKLQERGEIVVELYRGVHVWGRCTTGQAILLDGVIRDIALAEWPDEFDGSEY